MTSAPGLRRRRVAALAFAASTAFAVPAAADGLIATRFEVFGFAGVHVLNLNSRTEENGGRYGVTVDFATKGMARIFVGLTTHVQVRGRLVGGSAQPESFRNETHRNGVERRTHIDYRPDGSVDAGTTPPLEAPVGPEAARGTIDNLTAYFRLERQLGLTGRCASTAHVFDGRHGYDLVFSDAGHAALSPSGGQNFAGDAIACHMVRHDWPGIADPEKDEGARRGTIWYARLVAGDLMVPVRMHMDTQLGTVDGYLAELRGRGIDLKLME